MDARTAPRATDRPDPKEAQAAKIRALLTTSPPHGFGESEDAPWFVEMLRGHRANRLDDLYFNEFEIVLQHLYKMLHDRRAANPPPIGEAAVKLPKPSKNGEREKAPLRVVERQSFTKLDDSRG